MVLEAIADFWKPVKKSQQARLDPGQLQVGSSIAFGVVPQASLSGRKFPVAGINTYRFGDEALTSFILGDGVASMIVAESDGEQYLAISRRLSIADRMKMFDGRDLEQIMEAPDAVNLSCKEPPQELKGWTVPAYKREIQGLAGSIYRGDFRKNPLPAAARAVMFKYTLLVSDSNEHAIEIEQYGDGRVEVYATVYRRLSDISEVSQPLRIDLNRPDLKLASAPVETAKPATTPIKLPELSPADVVKTEIPEAPEEKPRAPIVEPANQGAPKPMTPATATASSAEKPKMTAAAVTGAPKNHSKQEIKTVTKTANGLDSEAIECDLRVANKIIDEAIRNEMRLSDVVRRIIELPVSHQEAVHIPVVLSDEDFALLAIRYSLAPTDRAAIKARIIEDLNSFSGGDSKKKAA